LAEAAAIQVSIQAMAIHKRSDSGVALAMPSKSAFSRREGEGNLYA